MRRVIDPNRAGSLAYRARQRRWSELALRFPDIASMTVLDLGGTGAAWQNSPLRPASVTVVNIEAVPDPGLDWVTVVRGDACEFTSGERFDLVYSNSLLEHVGGHVNRIRLGEVIRAAAPAYWVQTPYRYFPIEPHWQFPGMQFLPMAARAQVSRRWPLGYIHSDEGNAVDDCAWVELVGRAEMRRYFPDAELWSERFAGLTKSLVAIRQ
jgi:hypothetical protein